METKAPAKNNRMMFIMMGIIIVLLAAVLLVFLLKDGDGGSEDTGGTALSANPAAGLTYATTGVTAVDDEDALQKAVDEMYAAAREQGVTVSYQAQAYSTDGINFTCEIANHTINEYDMYIQIFADSELTDQLFLSGLLRPGEQFESITLDRALEPGTHRVFVVHTQVEEDLATIHKQATITIDFIVEA